MKIKRFFATMLMVIIASGLVACSDKDDSKVDDTTTIESSVEESTTNEKETTLENASTTTKVEVSTNEESKSEETTSKIEETTTIVETTTIKKEESTTKAPETTTSKPKESAKPKETTTTKAPETTTTPPETTTSAPKVESELTKKIKSFHIAKYPDEARDLWLKTVEGVGWVTEYGPTYRDAADNVDPPMPDCNDTICIGDAPCGHYPNPYTTLEWTTRKYWADKDEVTVGFYSTNNERVAKKHNELVKQIEEAYSDIPDCCHIKLENLLVGEYDNQYVWFTYFFRYCAFKQH